MKSSQNVLALILLLVVGGGLFAYRTFFSEEVTIETESIAREAENARVLFEEVNSISLDRSFLGSPMVNTLINLYVEPDEQSPGKSNPFGTIGSAGPASLPLELGDEEGDI